MIKIKQLVFVLLTVALISGCAKEETPTASTASDSKRVVTTTVAATEIMAKLNYDLVGIPTSDKQLPSRYQDVTKTGSPMSPDLEIIRSLKPDLVLGTKTLAGDLSDGFKQAGLTVTFLDFRTVAAMQVEIKQLGETLDRQREATVLNKMLTAKTAAVAKEVAPKKKPKVLILMGIPGSYLVATEHSYIGDLVKLAGGENVIQGQKQEYLASNTEFLQQSNPDIILRASHGMPTEVIEMFNDEFKTNDIWQHFNAVKTKKVYDLDETLFGMTGALNMPEALDQTVAYLYEK